MRLREFLASPATGSIGEAIWTQSMGTMIIRMPIQGQGWEGVRDTEFKLEICPEELRVTNAKRTEKKAHLDAVSGSLSHDCLPKYSCWYLESDSEDDKSKFLVVELCKAKDKSWAGPFLHGLYKKQFFPWKENQKPPPEPERKWQTLKCGKRLDLDDPYLTTRWWLFKELHIGQTDYEVHLRFSLDQAKLDECCEKVPMSKIFGADVMEQHLKVFIRGDEGEPVTLCRLGGQVLPKESIWSMTKYTREVEGNRKEGGLYETVPALELRLTKKIPHETWEKILDENEDMLKPDMVQSLEEYEEVQLRLQRDLSPDRENWTPEDFANEQKRKADERFKNQEFRDAVVFYTRALNHTPDSEKLLSNRSAAYMKIRKFQLALDDANKAVEINPDWPKAYFRQGMALRAMRRYDMAISAFAEGRSRDMSNPDWKIEIERTEELKIARQQQQAACGGT